MLKGATMDKVKKENISEEMLFDIAEVFKVFGDCAD